MWQIGQSFSVISCMKDSFILKMISFIWQVRQSRWKHCRLIYHLSHRQQDTKTHRKKQTSYLAKHGVQKSEKKTLKPFLFKLNLKNKHLKKQGKFRRIWKYFENQQAYQSIKTHKSMPEHKKSRKACQSINKKVKTERQQTYQKG